MPEKRSLITDSALELLLVGARECMGRHPVPSVIVLILFRRSMALAVCVVNRW